MTPLFKFYFSLLLIFLTLKGFSQTAPAASNPGNYAITNVNVITMENDEVLENQTVLVSNDRITKVAPTATVTFADDVQVIDGAGKYLIPGLTEMHGHIPGEDDLQYMEDVLFLYVANGVTTVRNMLGNEFHLRVRDRVNGEELTGPTIFAAGPFFNPQLAPNPEAAEREVRRQKEAGFDLLKMGSIDKETYQRITETAHAINIPFAGHIPEEVGLVGALEAGQKSIDHYDRYVEFMIPEGTNTAGRSAGFFGSGLIDLVNRSKMAEAVDLTVEAGIWNVPTLSLIEHLASPTPAEKLVQRPEMKYMPQEVLDGWVKFKNNYSKREDFKPRDTKALVELRRELTKELHNAGAKIALGSDAPQFFNVPGFSLHREMQMMVNAGLTPYEVLVTGTRNAANYFNLEDEMGTITPGKRADLVLLKSNPLQDISNTEKIIGVMIGGNWFSEADIDQRLQEIEK